MFGLTTEKKLLDALHTAHSYQTRHAQLQKEWNNLVDRINAKGGETFLKHGTVHSAPQQFGDEDLRRLIQLCHPDKHANSELSQRMTTLLTGLRK